MAHTTPTRELLVAEEAMRLRRGLLGGHHYAASWHDLEDIYSQAVLEVLLRARRDPTLSTPGHIRNTLRQRFASRLADHARAYGGRSPMRAALARCAGMDSAEQTAAHGGEDVVDVVLARERVREVLTAVSELPVAQRDSILAAAGATTPPADHTSDTQRKRRGRGRQTLRTRLNRRDTRAA